MSDPEIEAMARAYCGADLDWRDCTSECLRQGKCAGTAFDAFLGDMAVIRTALDAHRIAGAEGVATMLLAYLKSMEWLDGQCCQECGIAPGLIEDAAALILAQQAEIGCLRKRLEVPEPPFEHLDGIFCRDDTITNLDEKCDRYAAQNREMRDALDWIDLHKDDQDMNHVNFRIGAGSRARQALGGSHG